MADDFDKREWQAEQAARDALIEKEREKHRKARERSARNAKRKLERLHRTLSEKGEISEFEAEFSESVTERLDQFGSAFSDPQLGRPGDALSSAQKRVVAGMNRKVKDLKKQARQGASGAEGDSDDPLHRPRFERAAKPRSSFKSKGKTKWTPRVRQLDEDMPDTGQSPDPVTTHPADPSPEAPPRPPVGKPFLRIVK